MLKSVAVLFGIQLLELSMAKHQYPVPIPAGGRRDVHGWLILPMEQETPSNVSDLGINAWFSHHVPEFFTESPHNFQIILDGTIVPTSCVEGEIFPLNLPLPPANDLQVYEWSFTPPSPFSLNDLLSGSITRINGVYFNGSFDTPYERIQQSLSTLHIKDLTTATYLSETESNNFPNLRYLSYPRKKLSSHRDGEVLSKHFYFAHEVHSQPDFDHVAHGVLSDCTKNAEKLIYSPGASWEVIGVPNLLEHKLARDQVMKLSYIQSNNNHDNANITAERDQISCTLTVLESIHCMIGPGFGENC